MQSKFFTRLSTLFLISLLITGSAAGQKQTGPVDLRQRVQKHPEGTSFRLTRSLENSTLYSLVLYDTDERVVSGEFSVSQLQVFRSIMEEAKKFAMTSESVDTSQPTTTRFSSPDERSLVVDVVKFGDQSLFYVSYITQAGSMTVDAGLVERSKKKEEGLFFTILSQLDKELAKLPAQPPK